MTRFGPYTVHDCLGAGGMATVHRATLALAGTGTREVALKRLLPHLADDPRFVEDFVREAKLAAQLHHPNIVRILELGRIGRTYYIAMDLVRGTPLVVLMRRALLRRRPIPIGVTLALMIELCDALDCAHHACDDFGAPLHVVHRDLSPANLMVTEDGRLAIVDFGIAKAIGSSRFQTQSGVIKGKLGYMSPEAIAGDQVTAQTDVFSAGVVMWELLAGRRLFKARNQHSVIAKVRSGLVPRPSDSNPDCPGELDEIALHAVALSLDERWTSAAAMRQALESVRRRYHREATPRRVAAWARQLRADTTVTGHRMRVESEAEATAHRLSTADLDEELEAVEQPDDLPAGSQRHDTLDAQDYDEVHVVQPPLILEAERLVVRDDPTVPTTARSKFLAADTRHVRDPRRPTLTPRGRGAARAATSTAARRPRRGA